MPPVGDLLLASAGPICRVNPVEEILRAGAKSLCSTSVIGVFVYGWGTRCLAAEPKVPILFRRMDSAHPLPLGGPEGSATTGRDVRRPLAYGASRSIAQGACGSARL